MDIHCVMRYHEKKNKYKYNKIYNLIGKDR